MNVTRPTCQPSDSFMVLPGMKPKYTEDPRHPGETRLRGFGWLPNRVRHLIISCLGEYVGTFLFLFFAFSATQIANNLLGNKPTNVGTLLYISLAFGFSLAVNVWIFFRISGGLFNPAVSVAMGLIGAIPWIKVGLLIISQILAGISAAGIVSALFPGPLSVITGLNPGTSTLQGLFIETFLTFELVFCIFMLAAEKHRATFIAPLSIGLALFIAELAGVYYTGGSLNPARSFGPCVVTHKFQSYHWIYWIGPLLGAILAVIFYRLMKVLEYETANPGADSNGRPRHAISRDQADYMDDRAPTRRTMDGTDEYGSGTQFQSASSQPTRDRVPVDRPTGSQPAFVSAMDGHQSDGQDSPVNHPDDRPRAQHKRERSRSESYRNGPILESGTSSCTSSSSTASSHTASTS